MRCESKRIYVAARFGSYQRARALMDALTGAGHVITHDWTRTEEFDGQGHPTGSDADLSPAMQTYHAVNDQRGVRTADLIVVIADEMLCGALIELGMALAYDVPAWVIDPWRPSIFWEHPGVQVFTHEDRVRDYLGVYEAKAA